MKPVVILEKCMKHQHETDLLAWNCSIVIDHGFVQRSLMCSWGLWSKIVIHFCLQEAIMRKNLGFKAKTQYCYRGFWPSSSSLHDWILLAVNSEIMMCTPGNAVASPHENFKSKSNKKINGVVWLSEINTINSFFLHVTLFSQDDHYQASGSFGLDLISIDLIKT